ncbi:ubiquitin carboxyl-terminal hydrolase [Babesia ovis]|uniref:Ubiquitin carboxyl-terminal hydrolase n=1 Tax=Babesia ovis TaxID=5869 RepID=A0A9W5TBV4_BABOV|nr:ubiquitin carboxyl-terminal hydrolase [Babesia ovis]
MVYTEDDETQLMFDLYDGLDTFAQDKEDDVKPDEPSEEAKPKESFSVPVKKEVISSKQFKELENEGDHDYVVDDEDSGDDDGLVFLVEDDDLEPDSTLDGTIRDPQQAPRRKTGGWVTKYQKKGRSPCFDEHSQTERVIYVGAPNSDSQAMASTKPNKECFCLVTGVPWWMDIYELNRVMEDVAGTIAFSKILSDPANGASLGVALVEFVDPRACTVFSGTKTQFTANLISDDIFNVIEESPQYRDGIFKRGLIERIVAHLGLSLRKVSSKEDSSDLYHDIEFEVQQQEMIQNGDFQVSCKTFPWLNLNLVKFVGRAKRKDQPNQENIYDIANHMEAYKTKQKLIQSQINMMMQHYAQFMQSDVGDGKNFHPAFATKATNQYANQKKQKQTDGKESENRNSNRSEKKRSRSPSRKDRDRGSSKRGSSHSRERKRVSSRSSTRNSSHQRDDRYKR